MTASLDALKTSVGDTSDSEMLFLLVAKLVDLQRLSMGRGAEICEMSVVRFMEQLGSVGVAVFNYSVEELNDELRTITGG